MPKIRREMPSFNAVAAGQTASLNIPLTGDYYGILTEITHGDSNTPMTKTNMKSLIETVKLKYNSPVTNSVTLIDLTGEDIINLHDYYNLPWQDGIFPLIFAKPYTADILAENNFALGVLGARSIVLEIKLKSTITNPVLRAYGIQYMRPPQSLGQFVKLETHHYSAAATAGIREISDLAVVGKNIGLKALHITSSNMSNYEVRVNNEIIVEGSPALNDFTHNILTLRSNGRVVQSDFTHIDFGGNQYSDLLNTTNFSDFRLKFDMTSADAFRIISETVIGGVLA